MEQKHTRKESLSLPMEQSSNTNGKHCIILAISDNQDLLAASTAIEEMKIPLQIAGNIHELKQILSGGHSALGVLIAKEFLGEDASAALGGIKRMDPELPIIVAAAETSTAFEKSAREIGIFYYLLSPCDREEFLSVINALHSHQTRKCSL
ncbi:hypothetical protein HZA56_04105 [Candidatus Poribacteria bacterium]|nr:hypothetical protein [Candidatus Poribacteria bacterium]